jgi:hypothetical protein
LIHNYIDSFESIVSGSLSLSPFINPTILILLPLNIAYCNPSCCPRVTESLRPDVKGFKPGDAVFGLAYGGAYAQYIAVSTKMLLHKPENFISWQQAAGVSEVWITATQAMYSIGAFKKGKSILQHAGRQVYQ